MRILIRAALTAVCLVATVTSAALNTPERVRAFASLPDWSGLWEQFNLGPSGQPADAQERKEILEVSSQHPPYNSEWKAKIAEAARKREQAEEKPLCTLGFPALMFNSPLMFQAIVTPEETTLIFSQRETRHIYTDGRSHPSADELFATPWGDSIGHWEGETLVVETIATSSYNLPDDQLSDDAKYIERIRMVGRNTLVNQITVEDPISLTSPWRITREYHRVTNMNRLVEEDCEGNDRDPVVNGKFKLSAPKP